MWPGEFYAQIVENILTNSQLTRPEFLLSAELLVIVVMGIILVFVLPGRGPVGFILINLCVGSCLLGGAWFSYARYDILFDVAYPILVLLFMSFAIVVFLYLSLEVGR